MNMQLALLGFGLGAPEMLIVGVVAVLLFGKRLPEVARSLGKGMMEFKKGMHGLEDELYSATNATSSTAGTSSSASMDDHSEATAPKFEPPTSEPQAETLDSSAQEKSATSDQM